jgi:hypothetical protein
VSSTRYRCGDNVMWGLLISIFLLICAQAVPASAEKEGPFFSCSFEKKEEMQKLEATAPYSKLNFIPGIQGQALDAKGISFSFPVSKCLPETEGSLSIWFSPYWDLNKRTEGKGRLIFCLNREQEKKPYFHYNYFDILGHSYGDPSKGDPYNLLMLIRKTKDKDTLLLLPDDISWDKGNWQHLVAVWRINTNRKDGVLKLYLNGRLAGRRTDFRAHKIDFSKKLIFSLDAKVDELEIWDRMLTDEEIREIFSRKDNIVK